MCGIAGYFYSNRLFKEFKPNLFEAKNRLNHRGPDDFGFFYDLDDSLGLTHTRLSIIDTTGAGHQPMISADGNYVICFNGEIYNFKQLRDFLNSKNNIDWQS